MKRIPRNLLTLTVQKLKERGFSLITVAVLGGVVVLWMYAASEAIITTYERASVNRYHTVVRNALESGIDYAISQLNSGVVNGVSTSSWDATSSTPVSKSVSSEITGSNVPVLVTVTNQAAPTTSSLYTQSKDPTATGSQITSNGWRIVQAQQDPSQSPYAGIDSNKLITVILEPLYGAQTQSQQVPYFTNAIFAQSALFIKNFTINGNIGTYANPNSPTVTPGYFTWNNYPLYLQGNTTISGNASVIGSPPVHGSLPVVAAEPNTSPKVTGQLSLYGTYQNESQLGSGKYIGDFTGTPGATPGVTDTVGTGVPTPRAPTSGTTVFQPILTGQANNVGIPNTLFSAPGVASTYNSSPPTVLPSAPVTPAIPLSNQLGNSLGTLSLPVTGTVTLASGDYSANSITLNGAGNIQVSGPVRIFINSGSQSPIVSMNGNAVMNSSGSSANLQLWYNGTSPIYIRGNSNLTGVLYAPNAAVDLGGNATVTGAIVGYTVQASKNSNGTGSVTYDSTLNNPASSYNLTYPVYFTLTGFKATTWQEK